MSEALKLFDLNGKTAIITGGAGLLGTQFSETLAGAGAKIVIADMDVSAANLVAQSLAQKGYQSVAVEVDVTQPDSVAEMVLKSLTNFGSIDILVNSAALDPKFDPDSLAKLQSESLETGSEDLISRELIDGSFESFPLTAWNKAIEVNLTGTFLCCQAVVKAMLEQGSGVIVNLSSIYGIVAPDQRLYQLPGKSSLYKPVYYTVTKAGILGLTKYMAAYYAGKNIRVNALTPGGVYNNHEDDFVQAYSSRTVLGRMAKKNELNGSLLFLVSEASAYMTGANLIVDGGLTVW